METSTLIPGLPEPPPVEQQSPYTVFTVQYLKGVHILTLNFILPAKENETAKEHFRRAIERSKLHCERMRYKFLITRPYIVDLDEEEKRMPI